MWRLLNNKDLMGSHAATSRQNMLIGVIVLFSLLMAITGVYGIIGTLL